MPGAKDPSEELTEGPAKTAVIWVSEGRMMQTEMDVLLCGFSCCHFHVVFWGFRTNRVYLHNTTLSRAHKLFLDLRAD